MSLMLLGAGTKAGGVSSDLNNKAAQFTAANSEYLSSADSAFTFGDEDFAMAGWFYLDSTSDVRVNIGVWGDNNANFSYLFSVNTTPRATFKISNGSGFFTVTESAFGDLATDTWHFFYIDHDSAGNKIHVSINNNTIAELTGINGANSGSNADFRIGFSGADAGFNDFHDGRVDSLGIYSQRLDAAVVTSLFNSGNGKIFGDLSAAEKTGLVEWYDLFEASGTRSGSHADKTLTDNNTVTQADGVTS